MVYVKHSELGNKHVSDEEAKKLVNEGWVRWPRSKEEKVGGVKLVPPMPELLFRAPDIPQPDESATRAERQEARRGRNTLSLKNDK